MEKLTTIVNVIINNIIIQKSQRNKTKNVCIYK